MRIVGFVMFNGQRVPVDWSIVGTKIEHGVGLSADNVQMFINLPTYVDESGEGLAQAVEEVVSTTSGKYGDMLVNDLRVMLSQRDLPTYGNKTDLIARLVKDDATPVVEEVSTTEEVSDDGEA
jgi:hypothetical protein